MSLPGEILQPLQGGPREYDALIERIGGVRIVLIGEAACRTCSARSA